MFTSSKRCLTGSRRLHKGPNGLPSAFLMKPQSDLEARIEEVAAQGIHNAGAFPMGGIHVSPSNFREA